MPFSTLRMTSHALFIPADAWNTAASSYPKWWVSVFQVLLCCCLPYKPFLRPFNWMGFKILLNYPGIVFVHLLELLIYSNVHLLLFLS